MNKEKIQDALNLIDDELLLEVEELRRAPQQRRVPMWQRLTAIAACLCMLVGAVYAGGLIWGQFGNEEFLTADETATVTEGAVEQGIMEDKAEDVAEEETATEETAEECFETSEGEERQNAAGGALPAATGVTIAPLAVDLCDHPDQIVDMLPFFIYQGRSYVYYGTLEDASQLKGEYLDTATGLIDEWTEEDGYIDLAGSVTGDFYAVNGFETDFVLCMQRSDGAVEIFMNNNDITLYTGADLLKARFKVDGQFTAKCMSRDRWFNSKGVPYEMDEEGNEQIWALVEAMFDAPFVYSEDIPMRGNAENIYDMELYHLYLHLNNGMVVHLRLFDGGYVQLDGLRPVCIQVEEDVFWQAIKAMGQTENSLCGVPVMEGE